MKLFGKEFKFNDNKVYHAGDKPVAADIKFTDGKTFQQKLDDGSLRGAQGPQGAKGDTGAQGPTGATGAVGATPTIKAGTVTTGAAGTNAAITASTSGTTTTFNFTIPRGATGTTGATGPQGPKGDTGATGPKGVDGLTTSVTVNGTKYTHSSGNITLPNYPTLSSLGAAAASHSHSYVPLSGGTMTGALKMSAGVYLANDKYTYGTNTAGDTFSIMGCTTNNNVIVGATSQDLVLRSSVNPRVLVGSSYYNLYHSGNKPTASDVGALALSGGALTGNTSIDTSRYFQYKLTKGAVTTETGTIAQNTAVNMLGYSEGNNLHLGNGIWDNSITQGTTYVSGAEGLTLRTVNGPINFVSDKTSVGYVTTFGVVLGTNEAISSVSTGYKAYDIYRKCNSSLSGYSHTNARFGLVDADSGVAALETKLFNTSGTTIKTAYLRLDANAGRAYTDGYFQSGQKWMKLGTRWLTIDTTAPTGAKGDIWIQCY